MGFFKKLFGKQDETEKLLKKIEDMKARIQMAPNYQFCHVSLKGIFSVMNFSAEEFLQDDTKINFIIKTALGDCCNKGIVMPSSFNNLKPRFVCNEQKTVFGYILELEHVQYECECNFVGLIICNGEKIYYTNEYYSDSGSFGLCGFFPSSRMRCSFKAQPQTFDEFKREIIK